MERTEVLTVLQEEGWSATICSLPLLLPELKVTLPLLLAVLLGSLLVLLHAHTHTGGSSSSGAAPPALLIILPSSSGAAAASPSSLCSWSSSAASGPSGDKQLLFRDVLQDNVHLLDTSPLSLCV